MNKYLVYLLYALTACLVSCDKDDDSSHEWLLATVTRDHYQMKFEYDSNNRITVATGIRSDIAEMVITRLTYDDHGEIIQIEKSYTKQGDQVVEEIGVSKANNIITLTYLDGETDELTLDSEGYLIKEGGTEYTYKNGNVDTFTDQEEATLTTGQYTYDDKKSMFYACQTPKWWLLYGFSNGNYVNNVVKTEFTVTEDFNDDGIMETVKLLEASAYEYNENGYPATGTFISYDADNAVTETGDFTYTYIKAN